MDQSNRGNFHKQETATEAFYHSCLGKLIIVAGVLGVIFIGLISCIYAYINGSVDAISAMFNAIQ